jgi:hypothetical protein
MRNQIIFLFFCSFILFSSCKRNTLDIDVSGIKVEPVKVGRFERDLFQIPLNPTVLANKYGDFYRGFVETTLCPGGIDDPLCPGGIRSFVSDKDVRSAYADCQKAFPDMSGFEQDLTEAFRHFHYYFPSRPFPQVNTMMSYFNYSMLRLDRSIGIGLEMYLGRDCDYYKRLEFPKYKTATMDREHMLPDFVKAWMIVEFEEKNLKADFLTRIVTEGKIAYLVDAMLPSMDDTLKMGYTRNQLNWCRQNEAHIWSFFIKRKILYSTDYQEITQFTNVGPFTTGFSKESPARTGSWIGLQIVRSYMAKNKHVSLAQLMDEKDAQKLLASASYRPKL